MTEFTEAKSKMLNILIAECKQEASRVFWTQLVSSIRVFQLVSFFGRIHKRIYRLRHRGYYIFRRLDAFSHWPLGVI